MQSATVKGRANDASSAVQRTDDLWAVDNLVYGLRVAVLIPCRDEAATVAEVVRDFQKALPEACVYVYDNGSHDSTAAEASGAGAIVRYERVPGKGQVVRRMFSDIDADVYVLVDGDGTYEAGTAPAMVAMLVNDELDMVNGTRTGSEGFLYRRGHRAGNVLLSALVSRVFGGRIEDMMSGYRVMSRRFVKSFPAMSSGFETETELTIHALELHIPVGQLATQYSPRMEGSRSKLNTYSDGMRILGTITGLIKEGKPMIFFTVVAVVLLVLGISLSVPIFVEFGRTGKVPRFPTAILSTGIVLLSFLSLACGLILDSVARGRKEMKRLAYLAIPHLSRKGTGAQGRP
jgi:glycosyltransferase involved in cell wall biosynthesis